MELTFISEHEKFEAQEGDYTLAGNKVSVGGDFRSVECGQISKGQNLLGTFFAKKVEDDWKISLYDMSINEIASAMPVIKAAIEEMSGQNEG